MPITTVPSFCRHARIPISAPGNATGTCSRSRPRFASDSPLRDKPSGQSPWALSEPALEGPVGLSVVLIAVNASLAFFSYSQLANQFERQQASVRDRQANQLKALLDDRYQQMSRLANVVPLMVQPRAQETLAEHLRRALNTNGAMLDLEWDIRSVHWIKPDGDVELLWPLDAAALPEALAGESSAHRTRPRACFPALRNVASSSLPRCSGRASPPGRWCLVVRSRTRC